MPKKEFLLAKGFQKGVDSFAFIPLISSKAAENNLRLQSDGGRRDEIYEVFSGIRERIASAGIAVFFLSLG